MYSIPTKNLNEREKSNIHSKVRLIPTEFLSGVKVRHTGLSFSEKKPVSSSCYQPSQGTTNLKFVMLIPVENKVKERHANKKKTVARLYPSRGCKITAKHCHKLFIADEMKSYWLPECACLISRSTCSPCFAFSAISASDVFGTPRESVTKNIM